MKIALYELLTTVTLGGVQTSYWEVAKYLARLGHEVHIYGGKGPLRQDVPPEVQVYTFPFLPNKYIPDLGSRFQRFMERLSFFCFTHRKLIDGGYDIIFIRKPYEMPMAWFIAKLSGAKVIFRSSGTEWIPSYKFFAKRLDGFFANSSYNSMQIFRKYGLQPEVIYNGIDPDLFYPMPPDKSLMERFNIRENETVFVSINRLVGLKGIQYAIQALAILQKSHPGKAKFLIVGDGDYRQNLWELIKSLQLEDRVLMVGQVDRREVPAYLSLASLALFPTIGNDEAVSNALCEAMAAGVPVLVTTKGGIPEAVMERQNGFIVNPRDPVALAEKMTLIIDHPDLGKSMGEKARASVLEYLTSEKITEKLAGIFMKALEK